MCVIAHVVGSKTAVGALIVGGTFIVQAPICQHNEQYIIHALRKADALTISLVAEFGGQSIGKSRIHEGISNLKALGAKGCALVGDANCYH